MKISYSLKNLRRLISTPEIEIRPITILVGRNSVGKSTFLRSFPLLRQSIETKSSAPVLWYGDHVDFGDFRSAVAHRETSKVIEFEFRISEYEAVTRNPIRFMDPDFDFIRRPRSYGIKELKVCYGVGHGSEGTERKFVSVEIPTTKSKLRLDFSNNSPFASKVTFNEIDSSNELFEYRIYFPQDSIFSESLVFKKRKSKDISDPKLELFNKNRAFLTLIETVIQNSVDRRISAKRISLEARRILNFKLLDEISLLELSKASTKTFRDIYNDLMNNKRPGLKKSLDSLCQVNHLLDVLDTLNSDLSKFFSAVQYIGPARARSERFYRQQELEVSEISPDGKNLPMFLASLENYQLASFSNWVENTFGYGVTVQKTEGHISINLEQSGQSVNIVDTGYGVSQVLPVLAQIWWMQHSNKNAWQARNKNSINVKTLAIEQPELHLHPAHQALLADVFAESIGSEKGSKDRAGQIFIVETHSEALINRLGELIAAGSVSEQDVQIVVFGGSSGLDEVNNVTVAEYTEDGILKNWPYGFFNYS
ncbi:MAG: AAA family ATPase [Alphaproteobacteria bacterium]